jgi:hypothetical protein
MDAQKIDLLLQYTLLVASESDELFERELGPIHLIKYVYLADLAYAEAHQGNTFTEVNWRFHKFGPWSVDVFKRIDPALASVGANKKTVSHPKYEDDFTRWSLTDDDLVAHLTDHLPFQVTVVLRQAVRSFGVDTASLLKHVYLTKPMLKAAPGEMLDLSPEEDRQVSLAAAEAEMKLTKQLEKEQKERLENLKNKIRERLNRRKKHPKVLPPNPPPRYDDVFAQGQAWLDSLVGTPLEEEEGKAEFSEDVWKSPARYDPDLP